MTNTAPSHSDIVQGFTRLARAAGEAILRLYNAPDQGIRYKEDASPLTLADEEASKIILEGLPALVPGVHVVCEETHSDDGSGGAAPARFVLVDPLDGTKEFINKNGEFTVNIALVEEGKPVAGVVYAPAIERMFLGWRDASGGHAFEESKGAARRAIRAVSPGEEGLVVVASRSHRDAKTDEYLKAFRVKSFASAGSSLKFCMVAAGEADLYPRLGRTMEWDTAAGQAVLEAAGGTVSRTEGGPLLYGKKGFENPHFVARGLDAPR